MRGTVAAGRMAAAAVAAALALTACSDPRVADDPTGGDETVGSGSDTGAASDDEPAQLGIIEPGVDVADEPTDVAAPAYRDGEDGEALAVSDLVRTDDAGFAEVRWIEGALARIDAETIFEVTALDLSTGQPTVSTRLEVGRVWSRLEEGAAEYEVATDVGTAAVRGTGFVVSCSSACTFGVAEGVVELTAGTDEMVDLQPGEQVTVDEGGTPGEVEPFDFDDPWIQENLRRDEEVGFPSVGASLDAEDSDSAPGREGTTDTTDAQRGQTISGEVEQPGDEDRHTFQATDGDLVWVDVTAVNGDCQRDDGEALDWNLLRPDGSTAAGNSGIHGCPDTGPIQLDATGTWTLRVRGGNNDPSTGTYTIRLLEVTDDTARTAIGDTITGNIDHIGSTDRHTFQATDGDLVWVDVTAVNGDCQRDDGEALDWNLLRPDGSTAAGNSGIHGCPDTGPIQLDATGTWTLRVRGGNNDPSTGTYTIRLLDEEP